MYTCDLNDILLYCGLGNRWMMTELQRDVGIHSGLDNIHCVWTALHMTVPTFRIQGVQDLLD